jgi:predicted dehydrogenase
MAETKRGFNRRRFIEAAATGPLILKPASAFGYQANSAVEIGIVGCGGRGTWIGDLFKEFGGVRIVALADIEQARIDAIKAKLELPDARAYLGREAHKQLSASNLDAVVIETPTYFHPEQAAAAVAANKHVYCAKPAAVDVPGCQWIQESAKKALGKKCFWVDFQYRARPVFQECIARVRAGDLGTPMMVHGWYHAGALPYKEVAGDSPVMNRIRNFYVDRGFGGDNIVEQNIHSIDAMCWLMDAHPVSATGTGGRKTRPYLDAYDHFVVTFRFPGDVLADFSSTQGIKGYSSIMARLYGTRGSAEMEYGVTAQIRGEKPWKGPEKDDTFRGGAVDNIQKFVAAIRDGTTLNNADECVRSNLTAILGRTAGYRKGTPVTWDEMMKSAEKIDPKLDGLS